MPTIKWDKRRICDNCEKTNVDYKGERFTINFKYRKDVNLCQECLFELEKEIKEVRKKVQE